MLVDQWFKITETHSSRRSCHPCNHTSNAGWELFGTEPNGKDDNFKNKLSSNFLIVLFYLIFSRSPWYFAEGSSISSQCTNELTRELNATASSLLLFALGLPSCLYHLLKKAKSSGISRIGSTYRLARVDVISAFQWHQFTKSWVRRIFSYDFHAEPIPSITFYQRSDFGLIETKDIQTTLVVELPDETI